MTQEARSDQFDDQVAEVVGKLEGLPLFARRDKSASSLALQILAARFAAEEGASREDFIGAAGNAWTLEEAR